VPEQVLPLRERARRRTREEIREAAVALFLERGFAATSVEDVAAAAGVSRSTFFRYFAAKDEVLFRSEPDPASAVRDLLAAAPPGPALDQVRDAVLQVQLHATPPRLVRQIAELVEREPALAAANERLVASLADVIAEHLARRGVDPERADLLAGAVLGALRRAQRKAARGEGDPAALVQAAFAAVAPAVDAAGA
jgi:AcrR family transcriptional regulator